MLVSDFNYNLPENKIAIRPPKVRGTTRLLILNRQTGDITDSKYANLADFLEPGDLIVLNDTRVMRSRVFTELPDGRPRELVVLEKHDGEIDHVMYRGKLHAGDQLTVKNVANDNKTDDIITIKEILGNGTATVTANRDLTKIVADYGNVPLPPYLHRDADKEDNMYLTGNFTLLPPCTLNEDQYRALGYQYPARIYFDSTHWVHIDHRREALHASYLAKFDTSGNVLWIQQPHYRNNSIRNNPHTYIDATAYYGGITVTENRVFVLGGAFAEHDEDSIFFDDRHYFERGGDNAQHDMYPLFLCFEKESGSFVNYGLKGTLHWMTAFTPLQDTNSTIPIPRDIRYGDLF